MLEKPKYLIRIYVLSLLSLLLTSCMPLIKLVYGLHQPKYLSDTVVMNYARRLELTGDIYRVKDYSNETRSQYQYLGNSLPDILIFNSRGQLTKFEIDCSSDLDSIVKLSTEAIDNLDLQGKTIEDFEMATYVINSTYKEEFRSSDEPLYVIKFAEFVGKLNKENVPAQIQLLSRRKDVQYILLDMDYTMKAK